MKPKPLWQLSASVSAESEDAVAELMTEQFGELAHIYVNEETQERVVSLYMATTLAGIREAEGQLRAGLGLVAEAGLALGPGKVRSSRVKREDWSESWKRHFHPLVIGSQLLIKPSWSKRRQRKGQALVVLDPGLSFGTGQHATTSFCLRQLVQARHARQSQSFLDIGTGSGILAIAAAKLGYRPVRAFDFDPQCVGVSTANARRNRIGHKVVITRQDLTRLPATSRAKYDVICANLTFDLLLAERERILARLSPAGRLVLAGILSLQFERVRDAYLAAGMELIATTAEKEWQSGCFARKA
jgi:ribosomal protein L11 methyltransferase